jgi:hypothetical protein
MTKDEALKLALEALEGAEQIDSDMQAAIAAIKEALAKPVHPNEANYDSLINSVKKQPANEADQLLTALRLDPDTYRTEGGWLNIPKIVAAIKSPEDYPHLAQEHEPELLVDSGIPKLGCIGHDCDACQSRLLQPDWKAEYLKSVDLHCETLDELREAQADLKEARHANEKHIARIVDLQTHIENLEGEDR